MLGLTSGSSSSPAPSGKVAPVAAAVDSVTSGEVAPVAAVVVDSVTSGDVAQTAAVVVDSVTSGDVAPGFLALSRGRPDVDEGLWVLDLALFRESYP